jgi:hypothetical protein
MVDRRCHALHSIMFSQLTQQVHLCMRAMIVMIDMTRGLARHSMCVQRSAVLKFTVLVAEQMSRDHALPCSCVALLHPITLLCSQQITVCLSVCLSACLLACTLPQALMSQGSALR